MLQTMAWLANTLGIGEFIKVIGMTQPVFCAIKGVWYEESRHC